MALENPLGSKRNFDRLILLKIVVKCNYLVIEYSKICIVAPYEVSSAARHYCFKGRGLDDTELSTIAQSEMMTVGTVSQIGWVDLCGS